MITTDQALKAVTETVAAGRERGMKPLSAIMLDAGGHPLAFLRGEGASPGRYAIAHGKAYGAVMLGMTGTQQMNRAESQAYFMNAANGVFGGQVVPVPGGLLVRDGEGRVIGALGVTGDTSDNDAEAGLAGLQAAGLDGEA
ncbi:GlcG/HbpS family heme-binding protein [Palleronia sp. LCG004]|uniref:GlcG/HbpS family heme-binding protein n=1 Tax=Palleronia sp. LCG004 TaxID=3079304 RepID=UPI00294222BD|nr:heme-binding protein [Palleronia sp. LCG004]WOI55291.1 heme-binding protein [Palleronia sp. LCG004]